MEFKRRFKNGDKAILHDENGERMVTITNFNSKNNTYKIRGSALNWDSNDLEIILEGKKVKIKVDEILKSEKDLSVKYYEFITKNRDTIFTVKKDAGHPKGTLYTFEEDDLWLFWEGNLEIVE